MNEDGWSTEQGKNSSGFVLKRNGERLLLVGHGRWDVNTDERDQLYGRLLRLYSRHPDATRGVVVMPVSARGYIDEVSTEVRNGLGIDVAVVDPAAGTLKWMRAPSRQKIVDLDASRSESEPTGGVLGRLRRIFR